MRRGTCTNTLSLRRDVIKSAVLSVLENNLLQPELAELEQEKKKLEVVTLSEPIEAELLPHPVLLQMFKEKVKKLGTALNDNSVRAEAAGLIGELIQSVTIYAGERPTAEVSANITDLLSFAANENDLGWTVCRASFCGYGCGGWI